MFYQHTYSHSLQVYAGFRLACRSPLCGYAALRLRRVVIACCFRVTALSGHAVLALSQSGITPKLNRVQLSVVCCCGQSGGVIDLLARRCLPLGLPSAASGACAVSQKSPSKRQCGERQASLKAALVSNWYKYFQCTLAIRWQSTRLIMTVVRSSGSRFVFYKPPIDVITIQTLWHIIIQNKCMGHSRLEPVTTGY